MPVPSNITDLDPVANNNSPQGYESAKGTIDNYFRAAFAFIRQLYNAKAANGANTDITSLSGLTTALSVAQGGTGSTTAAAARTALGLDSIIGAAGPVNFRNRMINGNFAINQRGVSGTVTLAAGQYGHDRWKAGAGGCTYTFTTVGNDVVPTITSGSLMQVVEFNNVEGGVYRLSHQGTAQARVAVSGAATSGAYAATPLTTASASANLNITVEFTTGTVDRVMLESGTVATTFERRPYGLEELLCRRYGRPLGSIAVGQAFAADTAAFFYHLGTPMRATPTLNTTSGFTSTTAGGAVNAITPAIVSLVGDILRINGSAGSAMVAGSATLLTPPAGAFLSAEL